MDYEHKLTIVCCGNDIVAVHFDAGDSNIDGTLRIHEGGYVAADYRPGEWTHIKLLDVDVSPPDEG
jgi:hypothetical protein